MDATAHRSRSAARMALAGTDAQPCQVHLGTPKSQSAQGTQRRGGMGGRAKSYGSFAGFPAVMKLGMPAQPPASRGAAHGRVARRVGLTHGLRMTCPTILADECSR